MTINPEFVQYYKTLLAAASTIPDYQTRQSKLKALNDYFQKTTGTGAPSPLSQIPPNYTIQPAGVRVGPKGPVVNYVVQSPAQTAALAAKNQAANVKDLQIEGNAIMHNFQRPILAPATDSQTTSTILKPGVDASGNITSNLVPQSQRTSQTQGADKLSFRPMNLSDVSVGSNPFNSYDAQGRNGMYFGSQFTPFDPLQYAQAVGKARQIAGLPTVQNGEPLYDPAHMYSPVAADAAERQGLPYPAQNSAPSFADFASAQQNPAALAAGVPDFSAPTGIDPRFKSNNPDTPTEAAAVQSLAAAPEPKINIMVDPKSGTRYKVDTSGNVLGAL